jgi:hypothetical protein
MSLETLPLWRPVGLSEDAGPPVALDAETPP